MGGTKQTLPFSAFISRIPLTDDPARLLTATFARWRSPCPVWLCYLRAPVDDQSGILPSTRKSALLTSSFSL